MDNCIKWLYDWFICHDAHDFEVLKKICGNKGPGMMPKCLIARHDSALHNVESVMPANSEINTLYHIIACKEKEFEGPVINALTDLVSPLLHSRTRTS